MRICFLVGLPLGVLLVVYSFLNDKLTFPSHLPQISSPRTLKRKKKALHSHVYLGMQQASDPRLAQYKEGM